MTASQDFYPGQQGQNDGQPAYPTAFGITFTPTVTGAIVAVLGLAGAAYLLVNVLQPEWDRYQQLEADATTKAAQLQQPEVLKKRIADAQVKLAQAKQQKAAVVSLLGSEKPPDTLLLDINRLVQVRRGQLTKFEPGQQEGEVASDIVTDGSLGPELNGKIKRKVFNVNFEGNFDQLQSTLRSIERLQSLLVVKDFKADLDTTIQKYVVNAQGKLIPVGKPITLIKTSFKLNALMPLTSEEAKAAAAAPPAPK